MADRAATDALIAGLNEDLAHEYQAIVMYNSFAAMVSGIHRPALKGFFEGELPEELAHAQLLADKITALGGTPTTTPTPLDLPRTAPEMLRMVLEAERSTVARYVERRRQAEEAGHHGLAADLDTIISDETKHQDETEKLLRGLGEG